MVTPSVKLQLATAVAPQMRKPNLLDAELYGQALLQLFSVPPIAGLPTAAGLITTACTVALAFNIFALELRAIAGLMVPIAMPQIVFEFADVRRTVRPRKPPAAVEKTRGKLPLVLMTSRPPPTPVALYSSRIEPTGGPFGLDAVLIPNKCAESLGSIVATVPIPANRLGSLRIRIPDCAAGV